MASIMILKKSIYDGKMKIKGTLETLWLRFLMEEREITDISGGLTKFVEHLN